MIETTANGSSVQSFVAEGYIRRIPVESRGVSARNREWVRGGVLLEVYEPGAEGSAQLYLTTWEPDMIELINRIGVGKKVRVKYHISCRESYGSVPYRVDVLLDDIGGVSGGDDFIYRRGRRS